MSQSVESGLPSRADNSLEAASPTLDLRYGTPVPGFLDTRNRQVNTVEGGPAWQRPARRAILRLPGVIPSEVVALNIVLMFPLAIAFQGDGLLPAMAVLNGFFVLILLGIWSAVARRSSGQASRRVLAAILGSVAAFVIDWNFIRVASENASPIGVGIMAALPLGILAIAIASATRALLPPEALPPLLGTGDTGVPAIRPIPPQ